MFKTFMYSFIGVAVMAAASSSAVLADGTPAAATAAAPSAASFAAAQAAAFSSANPFYAPSTLPLQAIPWDKIKDSDYEPALFAGMQQVLAEVDTIANDPAAPTFDNTIVAMEKTGQLLNRVNLAFNTVTGANTDDALQKVQDETAAPLQATQDAISLNSKLFARIQTLYDARASLKLDPEQAKLLDYYYQEAVLAGAKLSDADKDKLKKLNGEEADLVNKFQNQLLAATKAGGLVISDKAELAGLSDSQIDALSRAADSRGLKGKWVISLQNTTQQPLLQFLSNRATREKLFKASWTRTELGDANDTRPTILKIAKIRAEKAKIMGYPNYAAWKLQDQMAKTPAAVDKFLGQLIPAAAARARVEAADIQAMIDKEHGGFKLEPWDWEYYAEKVRKAKYDLDDADVRPYFELDHVLKDGVFYAANQLYGLTFKERHDLPVWQPDVRVFEVHDKDGSLLAFWYCDYFKRDNKQGGAWMSNMVGQSKLLGTQPVVFNVANFTKPAAGQPALLSFGDVTTMFHEFGHALHGMFASQEYPTLSGTNVARDFVEFPSQFNENWALNSKVFAHYAVNYKTGKPMPKELVAKIKKAAKFNKGYDSLEAFEAAALDMQWHELTPDAVPTDVDSFETAALARVGGDVSSVPSRYRSSYFAHIWSNGYAAGYYAYAWTQMLDHDAYSWFTEHGGLSRANGQRFRDMILSRGNTEEYGTMFKAFRGRDPSIQPMLDDLGLSDKK
ncbi:MAG TPA: M3 family metallopeptidase [Gammaproteobacteria bacterium]|jgi:peptidyl-dipeptidase Dcp|nr:M3 family metallopeptidase [Gammaproteobacteria bacterium]